jgi:glycosyltransferase involved in cell wall biosynthesis
VDNHTEHSNLHKLRIGIITETFAPDVNGVAMTLGNLVAGLQARGHHVEIYRAASTQDESPLSSNHTCQVLMKSRPIPFYRSLNFGLPAGRFFLNCWQTQCPDVIYVATEGPLGFSAIRAARKLGIPTLSGFHTNFHLYCRHYHLGWLAPSVFAYLRAVHNMTAKTLVPTTALATTLSAHGVRNVDVMQRGIDIQLFNPLRRDDGLRWRWQAGKHTLVCLYVGRIAAEKNIDQVIDTMRVLSAHYKVRCVLVGDGPLRASLQRDNPDFVFSGIQQGAALATHYAAADMLLFASRSETYGNVVPEAMASGLAVLAYDEAAAHEHITDWYNGVLVRDDSAQAFTALAMRLCAQPETVKIIGARAANYCQNLSWSQIVQQFELHLHAVCQQHQVITCKPCAVGVSS